MTRRDWLGDCIEKAGWGNGRGHVSFNKSVTFTMLWFFGAFLGAIVWWIVHTKQLPPAGLMAIVFAFGVTVIGAGFGLKGYAIAKGSSDVQTVINATETLHVDAAAVVEALKRRDVDAGIDPA